MMSKALIITVGAQGNQIVYSLKEIKPEHVGFICTDTQECKKTLDWVVENYPLAPSKSKISYVRDDAEFIGEVVKEFNSIYNWLKKEGINDKDIIVNPTGGRKWMSAGAIMVASFLGLDMSYIDVKTVNNRPLPQTMRLVPLGNAYEQVGFLEEAKGDTLFNEYNFEGALRIYRLLREKVPDPRKIEIKEHLSEACSFWNQFRFVEAYQAMELAIKKIQQFQILTEIKEFLQKQLKILSVLKENESETSFFELLKRNDFSKFALLTTLSYAERCAEIERWDWAVVGLYRTLELISQIRLSSLGIDFSKIPEEVRKKYNHEFKGITKDIFQAQREIADKLALVESWILLYCLRDELFKKEKSYRFLDGLRNHLDPRNLLWIEHGNRSVVEREFNKFKKFVEMWTVKIFPRFKEELKDFEFIKF